MERRLKTATLALILGLAAAQLIQPNTINPPVNPSRSVWNDHGVNPKVAEVLRRACADCHSHETEWPWYSRISPISWMVARHVEDGRAKLNLSNWTPSQDQMEEILDSVEKTKMPLSSYYLMHPKARLSEADRAVLRAWVDGGATTVASN